MKPAAWAPGSVPIRVADAARLAAMWRNFAFFLGQVIGTHGRNLAVPAHVQVWAEQLQSEPRLVLLAPRSHGKTHLVLAFILWQFFRHGHDDSGRPIAHPPRAFQAVLFSATWDQSRLLMALFRDLLSANEALFPELRPAGASRARRTRSGSTGVRLASGAELLIRSFRTSTRGMHPDLLILDDALNDANSLTEDQRRLTWAYFIGTLLPMAPRRLILVGTAFHQADLLHRLADGLGSGPDADHTPLGFAWVRYAALLESGRSLWPEAHPPDALRALEVADPVSFAREYQNDPHDDSGSLFPFSLTQRALDRGRELTFVASHRKMAGEFVVMGYDLAISEDTGADYTVGWIAAYDREAQTARILHGFRERGLTFAQQIDRLRFLCAAYDVDIGVVENNAFQDWLLTEASRYPETSGRLVGHRTGREKVSLVDGVPSLRLRLGESFWTFPSGDAESLRLAREWQSEMSGFAWREGRLKTSDAHDDLVMAWWFLDRAIRILDEWLTDSEETIVFGEDLGIPRVVIGGDW